ncbi:uncharacterized protein V6R79_017844 [Siganus canaliculatus]
MAVSLTYKILWGTGIFLMISPHPNQGLLSDYKICGDSACESPMSRVLAIRDHHGKDCRFLSFRRGDTIFVYHKLTGKREDLWAGSIDKQFGYFPKDAVKEEQVHAAVEKVVETQKSDFFCMNEHGYPIDSSHLDHDEDDERIQTQESETIQTTYLDNTNVESALPDENISPEDTVSPLEADSTLTEEDANKNAGDSSSDTHKETQEISAAPDEEGGSASPSWLGSSVTGWFGLSKEEEPDSLTEREQNDERQEAPATNSLTDSVTSWLSLGSNGKTDDAEKNSKDRETADSLASTMTGWLGFGGEQNKDPSAEQEQNEEKDKDDEGEPAQTFRSRRMSLDLEGSHLHEDEKKEMGTFDWLENGLSNTLGFGLTSQESGHQTTPEKEVGETIQNEEEQPESNSWFGVPFGNILGGKKDGSEAEEKDDITEQQTGSENVDESQIQEDHGMQTNYDSQVEDTLKNIDVPLGTESDPPTSDSNNSDSDDSDGNKDNFLPEDAASSGLLEEKSQTVGETSSVLNSYSQKGTEGEEEDHSVNENDKEKNLFNGGTEDRDHQMPKADENADKENNKETEEEELAGKEEEEEEKEEEEMKTAGDTEQASLAQSDFSSVDLNSDSTGASVDEEDTTEEKVEEKTQSPDPTDTGEQTLESFETRVSDSDGLDSDGNRDEADAFQKSSQTEEQNQISDGAEESSGESQPTSSSATAQMINEAVSDQGSTSTSDSEGTDADLSDSQDNTTEAETQDESRQGEEEKSPAELGTPGLGSSLSMNGITQITSENDAEKDGREFSTHESTTMMENAADSVSSHRQHSGDEAHVQRETEEDSRAQPDPIQEAEFGRHILSDNGIHSAIGSETQLDEAEGSAEKEVQEEREELQDEEEQQDVQEEELDEQGKLNTEEEATSLQNQQEVGQEEHDVEPKLNTEDEAKAVDNQQGFEEEERDEEGELNTEEEAIASENQQEMEKETSQDEVEEEVKMTERQQDVVEKEQDEAEQLKENEQHQDEEEVEEGKQEETEMEMEIKMEKEMEAVEFEEEREGAEDQEEINKGEKQGAEEDSKEEEQDSEVTMKKDGEKQEEIGKLQGEEKQRIEREVKPDDIHEAVEQYKEEEKQEDTVGTEEEAQGEEVKEAQEEEETEVDEQIQPETESNESETQDENRLDPQFSTQMEKFQTKEASSQEDSNTQVEAKDEKLEEEEEAEQKSEDERGDEKDTDETLICSNHPCPDTSEGDGLISSPDGITSVDRPSPADDGETERGSQNPLDDNGHMSTDWTGVGEAVPSEGMEEEEGRKQEEEERYDGAEADDGSEKQGENEQGESSVTGGEVISDLKNYSSDNDPHYSAESFHNNLHHEITPDQAPQSKEDDLLYSSEAKNNFSDDSMLRQTGDADSQSKDVSNENEIGEIQSGDMTDTKENADTEERELTVNDNDVRVNGDVHHTAGTESKTEGGIEHLVSPRELIESQTASPVSQPPAGSDARAATAETQNSGAFGLLRNAFSIFGQKPATKSIESAPSLDDDTGEIAEAQTSQTPQQELDSTTEPAQVLHPASTQSQEQLEPSPSPPPFTQTASPSSVQTHLHPTTSSPNTKSTLQVKNFSKQYKNLLAYLSMDETVVLIELFGRHKLQFLDYSLGSSETMTDYDESILLDIERLLHYHRDKLVALGKTVAGTLEEDNERTRTLVALQKLETLLSRMLQTFNAGKSDTSNANQQAIDSSVDSSEDEKREEERVSSESSNSSPESMEALETLKQLLDFARQIAEDSVTHAHAAVELLIWVVSSLPDDIRPGPDLYGVPWEPVIISSVLGLVTILLFTCRCYSSVKSRMYRSKEQWMAEQIAHMLDEKCQVLEEVSKCQKEHDALEDSLRDSGVLAQSQTTEHLEDKVTQLGRAKKELERDLEQLKDQLEQQREHRREQEKRITMLEDSMKTLEEETKDLQSQDEQAQTTLKVYSMNSDRLQRNLETAGEENTLLQESNAQLRQQVEGWAERVSELEAEMSRFEVAHSAMLQDVANKDERILSLTDRLLGMKAWDSDIAEEDGKEEGEEASNGATGRRAENGGQGSQSERHLQKVQKLIYAAKLNADLKSVDEDKDRVFAKLNDEVKAKEDLLVSIEELENEKLTLQSDSENYSEQVQRLQQKLHIMTEMYQENELKLHRLLTVEEKERLQKEEKLNKADKNIALAMEELNNYRQRATEMEEELEKTKQSYQTQISAHEKKAHNNWLAARAADRELTDIRRENSLLRQKLTDTQFKLDTLDKDPYALDNLARPLPFRAERSPYGPSPLGRPASETRAFLSPPTLMDGPPARLSPRGYMFPEPGGPMFRRPPPGVLGHLPPPGPLHPRGLPPGPPHPADIADGAYRENSLGPGEQELRESGERRTPPESDPRMGSLPPPGPPMGPLDGPFPRRAPYGPPPPDFFPPRGPGGPPPMMPMWGPPRPGMMFPPRLPPGGPPLPPHPHHVPPMRGPLPDGLPPFVSGPPPPQQSPEEHTPSPEDAI